MKYKHRAAYPQEREHPCKTRRFSNHESRLLSRAHTFTSKYVDTLILFSKNLEPKVIDPYMTFDPMSVEFTCVTLPKDHCAQVPWQYINVCGYSDQFGKLPHTYTYYIHTYKHTTYRMSDHIVSYWTQFRRDKKKRKKRDGKKVYRNVPVLDNTGTLILY